MDRVVSPKTLQEIILDKLPVNIALIWAVLQSKTLLVHKYIDAGADVMPEISGRLLLLFLLSLHVKNYDISKAFIRVDGNVQFRDPSALHVLSQMGSIEIVNALFKACVDKGADVMPEISGTRISLLHLALRFKYYDIFKAFIRIDGNEVDFQDANAYHLVSRMETIEIVKALILAGADVNVQNEKGTSALHLAIEHENNACVIALTEADADVNLQDIYGDTPLHLASRSDAFTIIETLIKPGTDLNRQTSDEYFGLRCTALHIACGSVLVRNVEALIEAGADVNIMDLYGRSALHYALPGFLKEYTPNLDYNGLFLFGHDTFNDYLKDVNQTAQLLIDAGIDVNQKCHDGSTALHRAVTLPVNVKFVEELINAGADCNIQNDSGETALHVAYISNDGRIVHILKEAGVGINKQTKGGDTALHLASRSKANEIVRELIAAGIDINRHNYMGDTALHHNISGMCTCNFEVLKTLITSGACINIKNNHGLDPLQCMKYNNSLLSVCQLEPHFSLYRDVYGNTIFHFLIKYCKNIEKKGELETCLRARQSDFAKYLNIQNMFGETPLHIAASKESVFTDNHREQALDLIFSNFDKCGMDMFIVDEDGNTFFHTYLSLICPIAKRNYDITFIKRLLEGEYTSCSKGEINRLVQCRNRTGHDPFHLFINKITMCPTVLALDIKLLLEMFLKAGANINSCNCLGETVLHSLIYLFCTHQAAAELSVENGAEVNFQNIFGESPIFVVPSIYCDVRNLSSNPFGTSFKLLMKYGGKMDVCNKVGQTPLIVHMMQLCACFRSVISRFENNMDISKQDKYGSNLLHYIAWTHWFEKFDDFDDLLDLLNWPGLHVLPDNHGQLPCDVAYLRGHKNVLRGICTCKNGVHKEELVFCPEEIVFESLKQKDDTFKNCVQSKCKYFSEDSISHIMNEPFVGLVKCDGEAKAVKTAIISIVEDICRRLGEKDELLTNTVILSGSVAENTKIGLPDEFDFLCVLDKLPELFDIEESIDNNYMNVKLKKEYRGTACSRFFCNYSGFSFWQRGLLDRFRDVLQEILQMSDIYKHPNIFNVMYGVKEPNRSPNFALTFKWSCCKYKNMTVKIDLVPACQISCSPGSKFYSKTFNPDTNENKGVLIMFQNVPIRDGSSTRSDTYEEKTRASAVNVERKHLNTFRQEGKDAYVIAKILCSDRVCPSVKDLLHVSCRKRQENRTCSSIVSSYMLKNCLFHVAEEKLAETSSRLTVHGYVCRIFQKLLQCSLEENLPCYMFPWQNLFTFQSSDTEHETSIICETRAVYAKIILNMLGKNKDFSVTSPEKIGNESPFMNPPDLRDNNICANCKKSPDQHGITLETCSRCKLWTYCSVKCREENQERHKRACDYHYSLRQSASDQKRSSIIYSRQPHQE